MSQRFTWNDRLHRQHEFGTIFQQGRRFSASGLSMWVYRHTGETLQGPRLGMAIGRTYGNAVARNRIKRLLREVFRLNKDSLPAGVDLVFSARPMKEKPSFRGVEPVIKELWRKANLI